MLKHIRKRDHSCAEFVVDNFRGTLSFDLLGEMLLKDTKEWMKKVVKYTVCRIQDQLIIFNKLL
jgi:hypothetical protein